MATMTRTRRRPPTPEQSAKSAERRERFKALARTVAAMSEDERAALVSRAGAVVTVEGRPLSPFNSILLLSQFGAVSVVGGFWQWKRAGRRVRKGESALSLWIPTAKSGKAEGAETAEPNPVEIGQASEQGAKTVGRARFIIGSVFDITQTEPDTAGQAQGEPAAPEGWSEVEAD